MAFSRPRRRASRARGFLRRNGGANSGPIFTIGAYELGEGEKFLQEAYSSLVFTPQRETLKTLRPNPLHVFSADSHAYDDAIPRIPGRQPSARLWLKKYLSSRSSRNSVLLISSPLLTSPRLKHQHAPKMMSPVPFTGIDAASTFRGWVSREKSPLPRGAILLANLPPSL